MYYDFIKNVQSCYIELPALLYYSHIPVMLICLLMGFFVFFKSQTLVSKSLLTISLTFSIWLGIDLIAWISTNSLYLMFVWSLFGMLYAILFASCFYFLYVFIKGKDLNFITKIILFILILPIILFASTKFNVNNFNASTCVILPEKYYSDYIHLWGGVAFLWMVVLSILNYRKADRNKKGQITLASIGLFLFLFSFFVTDYLAEKLMIWGLATNFSLEHYGLFGMPVFMAFLAYLIVQYNIFNIKLLRAQALIVAIIILIGSQFAFIQNNVNRVLTGITLLLVSGIGWWLIRSIKDDDRRKEELQDMTVKLGEAYDKLKQLDRAKSEFVSIASHQLRTPLTAIKGFICLLLDGTYGAISTKTRDVIEKVYLSNERLIRLVEDLLNISRIESGRFTFRFEKNDIKEMVSDIVENMKFAAKNKHLYLDYKPTENPIPGFYFDKDKLREVISNLIDNAIKYTKKGGVSVLVKEVSEIVLDAQGRKNQNSANSFVQVIVSDTGVGIEKGEEQYIFEKFQRGKDISRVHTEGVGLGLYVAMKIIEAHEAKIWAESDGLGRGSRFIVQLKRNFQPPAEMTDQQKKMTLKK